MKEIQQAIIDQLTNMMPNESVLPTSMKGLQLFRIDRSFPRSPYSYHSEIIVLAQGEKRVYLGNEVYTYDPSRYLVLPVPLPADCEGRAEPGKPILGITIEIDPIEVGEVVLETDGIQKEIESVPRGIFSAPMNKGLYDATLRLVQAVADPKDRKVLAPMIKREMIYRVLQGEKGEILQALAQRNRRFFMIAKVLQKINESYSHHFDIEKLAKDLDMSHSTFHNSFKAVTETSPLQYIKNIRLHKAKILMVENGLKVNLAARQVGYESPSQFNREYKRMFGVTPAKDAFVRQRPHLADG